MNSHMSMSLGDGVAIELERDLLQLVEQNIEADAHHKMRPKTSKASSPAESGVINRVSDANLEGPKAE